MINRVAIVGFLSLACLAASAEDGDRIAQLEKDVKALELRISKLESLLQSSQQSQGVELNDQRWRSISNWRRLSVGMSTNDVRQILGEPIRVSGGSIERWQYERRGEVVFLRGALDSWREPHE
jgi:outer membrane protein assembly factor BamE (lipoprotein component of BamABCDE complex)